MERKVREEEERDKESEERKLKQRNKVAGWFKLKGWRQMGWK